MPNFIATEDNLVAPKRGEKSALLRLRDGLSGTRLDIRFASAARHRLDERLVPRSQNGFRRANRCVVGKFDVAPSCDFQKGFRPTRHCSFGVDDFAVAQINNSAVSLLHDLDRAASFTQATHLENIE